MSSLAGLSRAPCSCVTRKAQRTVRALAYSPAGSGSGRGAARQAAPAGVTRAAVPGIGLNAGPSPPQRFSPVSVLPLLSSAVESSAQVALAGRSAMIGFFAAIVVESVESGRQSIFSIAPDQLTPVAAAFVVSIGAAAGLAAAAAGGALGAGAAARGGGLLEAVVSSLTATRRSASGVTQLKVDEVVDFVLDRLNASVHPAFGPLRSTVDAGATVVTVMDSFILGDDKDELPQ
ncbi:MAG: hypothetical protein J3K34DRAFT_518817 [Monoraphidium minutum]|nr:MAG: hypothetical protein J3K34DRAFT_518817 [Monoraphidium minutum]